MPKICDSCNNCMIFLISGVYKCTNCETIVSVSPKSTLLYSNNRPDPSAQFDRYLQAGYEDPAIKKSSELCPNCGVRYAITHLGVDDKTVMICRCGKK